MDKELAQLIKDAMFGMYVENLVLRAVMEDFKKHLPPQEELDDLIAEARADKDLREIADSQFLEIFGRIDSEDGTVEALKEILKRFPVAKGVN